VEAVVAGVDSEPVSVLIERSVDHAFRLARAILLDEMEAEDAVQDACLTAWRRRASLRDRERFAPWFERILINGCRDRLRSRSRRRVRALALQESWHEPTEGPPRLPGTGDDDPALDLALDDLDPDHRIVVLLRYWQDLPLDAIADRLDVPVGTVKSRLHYAHRSLKASLEASHG
jgi:RNA polymerase sigma-70 factor (ECF subfamily)